MKFVDPDGRFNWDTNTIESGDTLYKIANECNRKYGTNYTADDLQSLNSDTISDKNKIYAGKHLNLGKAEAVQKMAADYQFRATINYTNDQLVFNIKDYHIKDGVIEIGIGVLVVSGSIYSAKQAVKKDPRTITTIGYTGIVTGGTIIAYGISRITGKHSTEVKEELKNIIEPALGSVLEIFNDSKRQKGKDIYFNKSKD